ncbi:Methyltransferase domain protein [Phycisphaerae bacterium RAS1]|nr:Methyltransferase domain protein [Phycisphaerae bacterium RAS1]
MLGRNYGDYPGDPELKRTLARRQRVFWDSNLGAYVQADLGDWSCRQHYFKGVYHDRIVPLLIDALLSDGGTFIDIGANRGIHTLHAARVLRGRGRVLAFEPNPATFDVLRAHLTINQISHCTTFNMGLAAEAGELRLNSFADDHSGTCSFVESGAVTASVSVPVRRLDDVLAADELAGPVLVKIDVEGFEHEVLRGMEQTLRRNDLAVVCEVTDEWLRKTGSSAAGLIEHLTSRGFRGRLPRVRYVSLLREGLELHELREIPEGPQFDAVFAREGLLAGRFAGGRR